MQRLKKRRNIRKLKIFFARLRVLIRIFSFFFIIWALFKITTASSWYLNKNIFTTYPNRYLELIGPKIVTSQQIIKKLQEIKLPKKPLYLINTRPIEKKLLEMPPIKKVLIRRYWWPARLKIVIDERTPIISISPSPKIEPVAVFTKDQGVINLLDREYLPLPASMHTYSIITYDDYKNWKANQVPYLEYLSSFLESATNDKLIYLDIRNPDDVYAQMRNIRLRIGTLNGKKVIERIQKVGAVIPEAAKIKKNISHIDLRWDYVYIKLKDSEEQVPLIKEEEEKKKKQ